MTRYARIGFLSFLFSLPALARAQTDPVHIEEVVLWAREQSPRALALRASVEVAEADVDLASVYPNPRLSYVGMGRARGTSQAINGSQHQVWLDLPLLVGGQRGARRRAAEAAADATRADVEVALLAIEIDARRAFVALVAAQDRVARLESTREELEAVRALVESRAGSGAESAYEVARIQLERARLDARLAAARTDVRAASAALAVSVGRPGWQPRAEGTLAAAAAIATDLERDGRLGPLLAAAERRLATAEAEVERARRERVPEVTVGLGAYVTTDGDSSSGYFGLSMPLPVFDTGRAALDRARAARNEAADVVDATASVLDATLAGALEVLAMRRAVLAGLDEQTLERAPELRRMAEASYRLGASGLFELLDAYRAQADLEIERIELTHSALDAELDVLSVIGARSP